LPSDFGFGSELADDDGAAATDPSESAEWLCCVWVDGNEKLREDVLEIVTDGGNFSLIS
jgi:hypothetical protein